MSLHAAALETVRVLPETRSMVTRDGVRLDADIYRPAVAGRYPVLLQRQAYGRGIACTICYAHPSWYAARGYIVVVQDIRGRGTSEGTFRPGEHDIEDGAETVEWVAKLDGSTGDVGMYGFSYQGYNQFLAAAGDSPSLKALIPAMGPWDARHSWAYENGALRLKQAVGWGIQITGEAARRAGDSRAYADFFAANQSLPVYGPIAAQPDILVRHRDLSHFMDWIEKPADDRYWSAISPSAYQKAIAARDLPMLFIGGWFDTHLGSTLAAHRALTRPGDRSKQLVIGPWLHFPWTRKVGALDFGPKAGPNTDELQVQWFDCWLKGERDKGVGNGAPIRLFDMGENTWRDLEEWPEAHGSLYLAGSGRGSIDIEDGRLQPEPGADEDTEYLVHDPWRPAPVTGGCYGVPPGPVDRSATDSRGDVLTFTTAPLTQPLTLAGFVSVKLAATADRPSFDVSCVLSRVTAQGQAFQLATGYYHCPPGTAAEPIAFSLQATCATLKAGERLRLSIAGASFPAHPINPGTGESPLVTPGASALITMIGIACGARSGSAIEFATLGSPAFPAAVTA
jgi:putative CocE/NonD family hydrolase